MWIGLLLVALVIAAGAAELYGQRRRSMSLRARFKLEYSSPTRYDDRLRRAELALAMRRQRADASFSRQAQPALVPVVARDDAWLATQTVPADYDTLTALDAD
jgi:hypothetical protein